MFFEDGGRRARKSCRVSFCNVRARRCWGLECTGAVASNVWLSSAANRTRQRVRGRESRVRRYHWGCERGSKFAALEQRHWQRLCTQPVVHSAISHVKGVGVVCTVCMVCFFELLFSLPSSKGKEGRVNRVCACTKRDGEREREGEGEEFRESGRKS